MANGDDPNCVTCRNFDTSPNGTLQAPVIVSDPAIDCMCFDDWPGRGRSGDLACAISAGAPDAACRPALEPDDTRRGPWARERRSLSDAERVKRTALNLCGRAVLLRPFREHLALLLLRELQVLLAEKAEARPFRAVPTSRKAAAHVALPSATRGCRSVLTIAGSRRSRQGGCYPVDEDLGESFNEGIERMRGARGHRRNMLNAAFGAT
jgi:hypothetical protein